MTSSIVIVIKDKYYTSTLSLIGLADFINSLGGDAVSMAHASGITKEQLYSDDQFIPFHTAIDFLETVARQLNKPEFSLDYVAQMPQELPTVAPIALLIHLAKTPQHWFRLTNSYLSVYNNAQSYVLTNGPSTNTISFALNLMGYARNPKQWELRSLALFKRIVETNLVHCNALPLKVTFTHEEPSNLTSYRGVFGCELAFNATQSRITYDKSILDHKIPGTMKSTKLLIDYYIERSKPQDDDPTMRTKVAAVIPVLFGTGRCNLEQIAILLQTNPKKIQRELEKEQTTFSKILDEIRSQRALKQLSQSNAQISQIAGYLDYSSATAFSFAFKRWQGVGPKEFRNRQNSKGHS